MTDQMSLIPDDGAKPIKKRGPYKKRQVAPPPERVMARMELRTALLNGLFETSHKVHFNPNAKGGKSADSSEKSLVLDKKNPERLQLREFTVIHDYTDEENIVHPNAITLRLKVPVLMGIKAETVLLSLLHIGGKNDIIKQLSAVPFAAENCEDASPEKALMLSAKGDAKKRRTPPIQTTFIELLRTAGMGHGSTDYELLEAYLEQMSDIRVYYINSVTGFKGSSSFLQHVIHKNGGLEVALNWRLTGAILKEYMYADIDLTERHSLTKDNSKTLHRWLSGHVWEGKTQELKYSTIAGHVWSEVTTIAAQKKREQRVRSELLADIDKLSRWSVEFLKDKAKITRHKKPKEIVLPGLTQP